jgi:hypothetical protein
MGALLRGNMMAAVRTLHARGAFADFDDFEDPEAFDRLMLRLAGRSWVVYAKKPFREVDHVLKYLGRYTHRVGISNSRIVDVRNDAVTFRTKNGKTVTVSPVEFLRRFVQHVLPDGFHKIRHYGLYAGAAEDARLATQQLIQPPVPLARSKRRDIARVAGTASRADRTRRASLPALWRQRRAALRAVATLPRPATIPRGRRMNHSRANFLRPLPWSPGYRLAERLPRRSGRLNKPVCGDLPTRPTRRDHTVAGPPLRERRFDPPGLPPPRAIAAGLKSRNPHSVT